MYYHYMQHLPLSFLVLRSIEIFTQKRMDFVYSRYRNPTVEQVADTICRMEMYDLDEDGLG